MKKCFRCDVDNPDTQSFCGACGAPLNLSAFIAAEVESGVKAATKDRDAFETESAIKIFQKAFDWMKYLAVTVATVIGLGVAYTGFKVNDLRGSSEAAKDSFTRQSNDAVSTIVAGSNQALAGINDASAKASDASKAAAKLAETAKTDAGKAKADIQASAATVRETALQGQAAVEDARKLRPEIDGLRQQLSTTEAELEHQKKLLGSASDIAKEILSSQVAASFYVDTKQAIDVTSGPKMIGVNYGIIPPPRPDPQHPDPPGTRRNTIVFLLLPSIPIPNTVSVQFRIFTQPKGTYFTIGNLLIFFWGDPPENLRTDPLAVTYYPDVQRQGEVAQHLTLRDDRFFADDQPMPTFTSRDKDFKGNRWMKPNADGGMTIMP